MPVFPAVKHAPVRRLFGVDVLFWDAAWSTQWGAARTDAARWLFNGADSGGRI